MRHQFTVILEREPEGGYHAFCPLLPGCHSQGDTVEQAIANIKEAIEVYVDSLLAHGEAVPTQPPILIASAEIESHAQVISSSC